MKKWFSIPMILVLCLLSITASASAAPPSGGGETPSGIMVPVVVYHVVSDAPSGRYQISTTKFKEQMDYLHTNGYTTLSMDEYYSIMTLQTAPPTKPILLTFDDNTADFYTNVYPILKQYGMKAAQFAVSDWVGQTGYLTNSQITEIIANNITIQNHTKDHSDLSTLSYDRQYASVSAADTSLTSITSKKPEYIAYPYGRNNADTIAVAQSLGIKMGFKVGGGKTTPADNLYELGRAMVVSSDTLSSYINKITP